jgi:xylulokinase
MDSSTTTECRAIEDAVGGASVLAARTGARAFERFTGPQIRAFAQRDPQGYASTRRVHLVSSFMASLLAGEDAAIDYRRWLGHELDGSRDPQLVAGRARRDCARPRIAPARDS